LLSRKLSNTKRENGCAWAAIYTAHRGVRKSLKNHLFDRCPIFSSIHDGDENIGFLPSKTPFECLRWEALVAFGDAARRIESFFKPPLAY
jgi:hypothetical protein